LAYRKKELGEFLRHHCKERGISLRRLSINSGLSPATVHNIINRKYQPTLFSLNQLADYLGVRREYLWQQAGLLEDYDLENTLSDPHLRHHFAQADRLPKPARDLVVTIIEAIVIHLEKGTLPPKKGVQ